MNLVKNVILNILPTKAKEPVAIPVNSSNLPCVETEKSTREKPAKIVRKMSDSVLLDAEMGFGNQRSEKNAITENLTGKTVSAP